MHFFQTSFLRRPGVLLLLFLAIVLVGCAAQPQQRPSSAETPAGQPQAQKDPNPERNPDMHGYIIEKTDKSFLVVWNVKQEDLTGKTLGDILDLASPHAMALSYADAGNLTVGDYVSIWTTGKYDESYPAQGSAVRVVVKEHDIER